MSRLRIIALALATSVLLLAGCSYDATEVPPRAEGPAAEGAADEAAPCDTAEAVRSYAPGDVTAEEALAELRSRTRLTVGISADSYLLGARNPITGKIRGFDIDVAQRIARALGVKIDLRVISADSRITMLEDGTIDLVVRNMTINCERWESIAFSAEYYRAGQKVLVRDDEEATSYSGPEDLADRRVCAPSGTTSIDRIRKESPDAEVVAANNHTGCLVLFQQGEVDAITGDDTVLAGLAAQDPYAVVPPQQAFSDEPYGVGVGSENTDLVRFVNRVLEEMRRDGSWQRSYDQWLQPYLGPGSPPTPAYGR